MRLALLAPLALAACTAATPPPQSAPDGPPPLTRAKLGQTVRVDGPSVTPLAVLEDSRCPMNARCVWAGRVRISARIDLGRGSERRELTQGQPIPVADGTLELVEVQPDRRTDRVIEPGDYRFGFRFMGGI